MTDFRHVPQRLLARLSLKDWAAAIAMALVAMVLLGVVPRMHW